MNFCTYTLDLFKNHPVQLKLGNSTDQLNKAGGFINLGEGLMSASSEHGFIEHPWDHPFSLRRIRSAGKNFNSRQYHVYGGISLITLQAFKPGTMIEIRTRIRGEAASFRGRILWIKEYKGKTSQLGVVFEDTEQAYRARMIEQLCHIEHYRREQYSAGRHLAIHEAAHEWIEHHSPSFPQIGASIPKA